MENHFNCKEQSMLNFKAAILQKYVQTLVPLWCHHYCSRIYHLASSFSVIETGAFSFYKLLSL